MVKPADIAQIKFGSTRIAIAEPVQALRQVNFRLDYIDVGLIKERYNRIVRPLKKGWKKWEKMFRVPERTQVKREPSNILGGESLGAGIVNSMDMDRDMNSMEVLANKLARVSQQIQQIQVPLTSDLSKVTLQEWFTAKLLPKWQELNDIDRLILLKSISQLQNDTLLALSYIQAQGLGQEVIQHTLRQGYTGIIPLKIRKILIEHITEMEASLQAWFKSIHFTYDSQSRTISSFILTGITAQETIEIFPIAVLGLRINGFIPMTTLRYGPVIKMDHGRL